LPVHFGLGHHQQADSVEIWWPSGVRQALANVLVDRYVEVRERP